jgi:RND family efflux transporter MFP subunit
MKHAPIALAVLAALLLAACGKEPAAYEEIRPVRTVVLKADGSTPGATYSGDVRARRETTMGFRLPGQVVERYVELGQAVKAGQPLMRLDSRDATLQRTAARSQYDKARVDLQRAQALHAKGFVSQSYVDAAKAAFDAAEAQFKIANNQSGYTTLRAERAGIVTALLAEVGQVVAAGQAVLRLAEDGEREVVVSVPEGRVEELRRAKDLKVTLWAAPEKQYDARLREIAPDTDPVTRTYAAKITLLNPDDAVRLGMTAYVLKPGAQTSGTLSLPMTAIVDRDGQPKVWVVDPKTSRVTARPVKLAGALNDTVLVADGVKAGEVVVTAGAHLLHANQKVRLAASQLERP